MGVSHVEARFLSGKARFGKVSRVLCPRLNTVEVNYTFRRFPTDKLLEGWIAATPAGFQFAVKAHQTITHIKRLRDVSQFTIDFLAALRPLQEAQKLGPVLFQLPPFLKADVSLLKGFLAALPRNLRAAFEFRNDSWFSEEIFAALREANAALCEAESEKLETPEAQTADFSYFRLRKEEYSSQDRKVIAAETAERVRRGDVYVFFKHEDTPEGALHAEKLLEAVKAP